MAKKGQVFKKCSAEFIKKISLPKTNGFAWRKISANVKSRRYKISLTQIKADTDTVE